MISDALRGAGIVFTKTTSHRSSDAEAYRAGKIAGEKAGFGKPIERSGIGITYQETGRMTQNDQEMQESLRIAKVAELLRQECGGHWKEHPKWTISEWRLEVEAP